MKLRATVLFFSMAVLIASFFISDIMLAAIPEVGVIKLTKTVYNQYLNCSGSIEQAQKNDVSLDVPVILSHIDVEVGDYVQRGQRLAVVNKDATIAAYSNLDAATAASMLMGGSLSGIPDQLLSDFVNSGGTSLVDLYEKNRTSVEAIPNTLKAPENGVVTAVNAYENELTTALTPIFSVAQTENLVARVSVSESNISKVKEGQKAVLTIIANAGASYECIVAKIYPTATRPLFSTSGEATVDVILKILKPDAKLKPGYTTKARIITQAAREALVLPYEVVGQDNDENEYVYVYSGGIASKRIITTGNELLYGTEVVNGVLEDELVITNPSCLANDSCFVRVQSSQ